MAVELPHSLYRRHRCRGSIDETMEAYVNRSGCCNHQASVEPYNGAGHKLPASSNRRHMHAVIFHIHARSERSPQLQF